MPPPSPHFDDEATLLTARPVVPISKAADLGSVRSYLVTGIIIVAAAFAGAAAVLSVNYFQNLRPAEAAVMVEPSAPASDGTISGIPETLETSAPQSSAAIPTNTTTSAQTDLNVPAPIDTKETKQATNSNQIQKKSGGNESPDERRRVVEKRPERSELQPHAAKIHSSVDSAQSAGRRRDASSIREIFEGPSPF